MKRVNWTLLCLLALVQVGIAQTREIKTQKGGALFLPQEISALLGYSPYLENQEYRAEYYELAPKDEVLGVGERVLHGRFFAKYPKAPASIRKSNTLVVAGEYRDGKMLGRWLLEDVYVDIEDGKLSYFINDTLSHTAAGYTQVLTRKVKVVKGVAQDKIHLCLKHAHDGKPLSLVREIIVPLDKDGWANGLVIDRVYNDHEYRYHYHHGFLISSAFVDKASGQVNSHTELDKATFEKEFDPSTGEIIREQPDGVIVRYKRVPSPIAGKLERARWFEILGGNELIYPALTRAFADIQEIEEEVTLPQTLFNTINTK